MERDLDEIFNIIIVNWMIYIFRYISVLILQFFKNKIWQFLFA